MVKTEMEEPDGLASKINDELSIAETTVQMCAASVLHYNS